MKLFKALVLFALAFVGTADAQVFNQFPFNPGSFVTAVAPATPAATSVKASAGQVMAVTCFNILATPVYVKLFNATSVTLGTTSAAAQIMCPGNAAGAGAVISFSSPLNFTTGIQYAVTGGIGLTDNTAITASSVTVTIEYL